MKVSTLHVLIAAVAAGATAPAFAQTRPAGADYPNRVVRIVLPQPAGGGTDVVARSVAQKLSDAWGQQVIVDNRPGANGIIGSELVAKSKPDGYTLLYGFGSLLSINSSTFKSLPYDTLRDFTPITQTVMNQIALVVNPHLPARSVKELVALARARPGDLLFGSFGMGNQTHLTAELFRIEAKLKLLHVPYKGETPSITELVSGQVALMFSPSAGVTPHVRSGRLRLLALCGEKRSPAFPDIPTMVESGYPGVVSIGWGGLVAPTGTPQDIVQKTQREAARGLSAADVKERLSGMGADPVGSTPEEFGAFIRSETAKWERVVKGAGLYHSQ
ncbi:MAG TPA: tripartite tricarboxylate transporter substrate binding protein [Burkholderiales bacterium]|nr:tripartite tricarboxylate transporter substrate binding protein [Burkholderiales bacterium]